MPLENFEKIFTARIGPAPDGAYRHWDELIYRDPPEGLNRREWWLAIKMARESMSHPLPLKDTNGMPLGYTMPDAVLHGVHKIDQLASGRIAVSEVVTNPATRDRYLISSLMEEAITSSQLEGASTSRRVAKEMMKSGRRPRTRSERMIHNNYRAINLVRELREEKMTPELVYQLHEIVTEGTLDDPDTAGRPQLPHEERVKVVWTRDTHDKVLHDPPPAEQLPERMEALCRFANGDEPEWFVHPVVRATITHFWLSYDHPFVDGNGRSARALFYWSMLSQGYWLTEYLTISNILKNAPAKYARSFLHAETDSGDVTYFVIYQLKVILRAIEGLNLYLRRKMTEVKETESLMKHSPDLNRRQVELLSDALRNPDAEYSVKGHATTHNIGQETARLDLVGLEERDLLVRQKIGKANYFAPPHELSKRLRDL
jgi:Fic family protein